MLGTLRLRRSEHVPEEIRHVLGETAGKDQIPGGRGAAGAGGLRFAVIPGRGHTGYAAPRESRETCLIDGSRYAI